MIIVLAYLFILVSPGSNHPHRSFLGSQSEPIFGVIFCPGLETESAATLGAWHFSTGVAGLGWNMSRKCEISRQISEILQSGKDLRVQSRIFDLNAEFHF